jgi:hypothetical protein
LTSKVWSIKRKTATLGYIKIKNTALWKALLKGLTDYIVAENVHIPQRTSIKIYKELSKFNSKKANTSVRRWGKAWRDISL